MGKFFSKINQFTKSYFKAFLWCCIVLFILFLPILCSAFLELLIDTKAQEQESFQSLIVKFIDIYINNGSFPLIIIGISSSAYIDYLFEIKMKNYKLIIHIWYFFTIAFSLMMYTAIFTLNPNATISTFIDTNLLKSSSLILFVFSVIYSIFVKAIMFDTKKLNFKEQNLK